MVGRQVRAMRKRQGVSGAALAKRAGVTRGYIHAIETGEANPTLEVVASIAKALGAELQLVVRA